MPLFLSPVCNDQTFDANGDPLNAGQIETYLAGSSTPAATYTDDTGGTPQSNPIILNSLGYPTLGPIWLTGGQSYKFIIKDSLGVTLRTIDDISGVNDASVSQSEWVTSGFTPTFIGATSFSVPGDQTAILQVNRRLRTTNTSGFIYSTISNSVFAAGITTVTVVNDSGSLDAGLTTVEYGLIGATNNSVPAIPVTRFTMSTARMLGRTTAGTGSIEELTAQQSGNFVQQLNPIQPMSVAVASNAMTITLNPCILEFRDTVTASGTVNRRVVPSAINLTVSSGSTLGTANGVTERFAVLAIDNAGTVELAIVNLSGGVNLDEQGLISTTAEGGAGGADSASTIYSTSARASVPYRIVDFLEGSQVTAGTWAVAPSRTYTVDPQGAWRAGYGQTWQNVLASRATATNYTNTTGRRIQVSASLAVVNGNNAAILVDGVTVGTCQENSTQAATFQLTAIVPPGSVYRVNLSAGTLSGWAELR